MSDEIDDELQGLLSELELEEESTTTPEPEVEPEVEPESTTTSVSIPTTTLTSTPTTELPDPTPELPAPTPVLVDPEPIPNKQPDTDLFVVEDDHDEIINVREFIAQHSEDYNETKGNLRKDRAKADQVVRALLGRVEDGEATGQETEALVSAVKCLIDSNGHMVRLLDSKTKLLASQKRTGGTLVQTNIGRGDAELINVLSQLPDEDEI